MSKKVLATALVAALSVPTLVSAQDSPHTLTANVGLYSQYIFRGLTQTNEEPAIQGGFDYSHSSGLYLGVWGSNVSWLADSGQYSDGSSLELDIYGGFKNSIGETGISYDVGLLQYWYPGDPTRSPAFTGIEGDTLEAYAAVGWKWFTLKYSHVISDEAFAVKDAQGTGYWDLSASFPVGETGITLGAHYGIQTYEGTDDRNPAFASGAIASNDDVFSYDDWRVSVAYDLGKASKLLSGAEIGVMYTDTSSANKCGYGSRTNICSVTGAPFATYPKNIAQDQVTVWVKKTF